MTKKLCRVLHMCCKENLKLIKNVIQMFWWDYFQPRYETRFKKTEGDERYATTKVTEEALSILGNNELLQQVITSNNRSMLTTMKNNICKNRMDIEQKSLELMWQSKVTNKRRCMNEVLRTLYLETDVSMVGLGTGLQIRDGMNCPQTYHQTRPSWGQINLQARAYLVQKESTAV